MISYINMLKYSFFFWSYFIFIGSTYCYSVNNKPVVVPQKIMLLYNLVNSLINFYIVVNLFPYVFNKNLGVEKPHDNIVQNMIYLHYMTKYLDFFDTFFMILRHKWKQVHFLQLFHHSTIGLVWYYALNDAPKISATISFGAFINSIIHTIMYLHYFITALKFKNPYKKYLTRLQMIQFVVCIYHAYYVQTKFIEYRLFSILQITYMLIMISLFYIYVYMK